MKKKRTYQAPLVLTVAALTATACGANDDPQEVGGNGTGGGTGGSTGGTTGGTGGATGGTVGTGGSTGGSVGQLPACDSSTFYTTECQVGARCQQSTDCPSGTPQTFVFECTDQGTYTDWVLTTTACDNPYEQCMKRGESGSFTCIDSTWRWGGYGGNPPAPCPETLPEEDGECFAGGSFGADPAACGYPCADGSGWTVTGCVSNGDQTSRWQSDGACTPNGNAGGAGAP